MPLFHPHVLKKEQCMKKQSSFEEVVQYAKKLTHPKFMDVL